MFNVSNTIFSHLILVTNTIVIKDIVVPSSVPTGNASTAVLDCIYDANNASDLLLKWYFNDGTDPVYEWRPRQKPVARGVLVGHLDLSYRKSENPLDAQRAMHITNLVPGLSGEYTCVVQSGTNQARATKSMLVYSPQEDLSINWNVNKTDVMVRCAARGVYPKPDLLLQRDWMTLNKQHSRSWQNGRGGLYDAEVDASFRPEELRDSEQFVCRLRLPEADYLAVKETTIAFRNATHNIIESMMQSQNSKGVNSAMSVSSNGFYVMISITAFVKLWLSL